MKPIRLPKKGMAAAGTICQIQQIYSKQQSTSHLACRQERLDAA